MNKIRALLSHPENIERMELVAIVRQLLAEAEALSTRIAIVNEIAVIVTGTLSIDEILRLVGKKAKWLLDFDYFSVCLRENGDQFTVRTLVGEAGDIPRETFLRNQPLGSVVSIGHPLLVDGERPRALPIDEPIQMIVPLRADEQILGTINFARRAGGLPFRQEDLRVIHLLALQLSAAIFNALNFGAMHRLMQELQAERIRSDQLLLNILPAGIASELKDTGKVEPVLFDCATVMFVDFCDFTLYVHEIQPHELLETLNEYFTAYDAIIQRHHLEKLKTIGDSYMCAAGIPYQDANHALHTVRAAVDIMKYNLERLERGQRTAFHARIGIHTGPVIAGIIGAQKFAYDVWGETVNIAARLESASEPDRINISRATYELVRDEFDCVQRGKLPVKNVPDTEMFFVTGERAVHMNAN